jgi:hypothetical protein
VVTPFSYLIMVYTKRLFKVRRTTYKISIVYVCDLIMTRTIDNNDSSYSRERHHLPNKLDELEIFVREKVQQDGLFWQTNSKIDH